MTKLSFNRATFTIHHPRGSTDRIDVLGRQRWALEQLIAEGPNGCTPFTNPAPRWAAYIHGLRALGIEIETISEQHDGPFAGTHARYVLRSYVKPILMAGDA